MASPGPPSALELQQASLKTQRESVGRQLSSLHPLARQQSGQQTSRASNPESVAFADPAFNMPELPRSPFPEEAASLPAPFLDCPAISRPDADNLISSAAEQEEISPALLRAVIKRESAFRPCAVSPKGALGLMQLMPATAAQFGVEDPFNPRQNVLGGAAFLKKLLNRFGGDVRLALGAYNAGPERVEAAGGVPDLSETQQYVSAIAADLDRLNTAPPEVAAEVLPAKEIINTMTKPDLRHLTLGSPNLQFQTPAMPAHLISGQ